MELIKPNNKVNSTYRAKIKYYGVIGSTGYAKSTSGYINALVKSGAQVKFHKLGDKVPNDSEIYDIVIIQHIPPIFQKYCNMERRRNPNVKIFALTMWECDRIPLDWADAINKYIDCLIVPCGWNKLVFSKDVRIPIYVVHQNMVPYTPKEPNKIIFDVNDGDYVFYTIGQWTARKQIDKLIRAYLSTFEKGDKVVLFLKTYLRNYSNEEKKVLSKHILKIVDAYPNPASVIFNLDLISDDEIHSIHERGNCFVSPCASEAIGLGACYAGIMGKKVIITGYGGQLDYLKDVDFIKHTVVPSKFCKYEPLNHCMCRGDSCVHFPMYNAKKQNWGNASIQHLSELMLEAYKNRSVGSSNTKQFLLENFNAEKIGREFMGIPEFDKVFP
jgi:glycosyltransferase involved in cell wall biosynthesis